MQLAQPMGAPVELAIERAVEGPPEEVAFFQQEFAGQLVVLQVARAPVMADMLQETLQLAIVEHAH